MPMRIGPIAVAEGFAKPVVEIDEAALKIDLAAALRAIRQSLKEARVVETDASKAKREVEVAANERRERG